MLIIFDWDGTILNSEDKIVSCMQSAAGDCGLVPCSAEDIRNIIGLELNLAIQRLYPSLELAAVGRMRDAYAGRFVQADQKPCQFFPGAEEGLKVLAGAGHTLAVATGKSRRGLDRVFSHLAVAELFSVTRCADETASKPDPLMLAEICETTGTSPDQALMVGDTEYDLEMAQRIGMPSVGVSYGAHSVERLQLWRPLVILDNLMGLSLLVEGRSEMAKP